MRTSDLLALVPVSVPAIIGAVIPREEARLDGVQPAPGGGGTPGGVCTQLTHFCQHHPDFLLLKRFCSPSYCSSEPFH